MPEVSIHAPARGATRSPSPSAIRCSGFNPRSREGSDVKANKGLIVGIAFQSTLPRGERRW